MAIKKSGGKIPQTTFIPQAEEPYLQKWSSKLTTKLNDMYILIARYINDVIDGKFGSVQAEEGDVVVLDNTKGIIQKSANGHYWRQTVSDLGVATWADLGTTLPDEP